MTIKISETSFSKALVALDLSEVSDALVSWLPSLEKMGVKTVYLHHTVPLAELQAILLHQYQPLIDEVKRELAEEARKRLEKYAEELRGKGLDVRVLEPAYGDPAENILNTANLLDVDLIVLGSAGHRSRRTSLGSVGEEVVKHSRKPVLIAKARVENGKVLPPPDPFEGPIMVALAFDPEQAAVLGCALAAASASKSAVVLLHVLEMGETAGVVVDRLFEITRLFSERGLSAKYVVSFGNPAKTILSEAEKAKAKLIIIGGRGTESFLGSTLDTVLRRTTANVLICR